MTSKFRLYYNDDGSPKFYSMEELEGKFIFIDQPVFESSRYDIKVVDGKIKSLNENTISKYHLTTKKTRTTIMCDREDISILNDKRGSYNLWDYTSSN